MKILFYLKNNNSLKLKSLGGIETLNLSLYKKVKKINNQTYLSSSLSNKLIQKKWDCIISSNSAQVFDKTVSKKNILWLHNKLQLEKSIRKNEFLPIIRNKIITVFNSKYLERNTTKIFNFKKRAVIPNFLTTEFTKRKKKIKRQPHFVWSVQRKLGLDKIIDLWIQKIYPLNKNFKFFIFGLKQSKTDKYDLNKLKKYNIFFMGRVRKSILIKYYSRSMAMICLGYDETFALNVIEGFSCGLPMITFGYTAVGELVNNKNSFILKDYNDFSNTVSNIANLNLSKRSKISNYCIKYSNKYILDKIIRKWVNIIGL